jgi:FkbM family methyltransferase
MNSTIKSNIIYKLDNLKYSREIFYEEINDTPYIKVTINNFNSNNYIFYISNSDLSGLECIDEIIIHNEYILDNFVNLEKKNIFDIGANIGIATVLLAKQNPNSIIYAFEPFLNSYNTLLENINLNNLKNIIAINKAVSNVNCIQELAISESISGANTLYTDIDLFKNDINTVYAINNNININNNIININIEVISFEDFIKDNNINEIELLKIDCEGSEYDILYNNSLLLNKSIKNIVGEFHNFKNFIYKDGYNFNDLYNYIEKYIDGYKKITFLDLTERY